MNRRALLLGFLTLPITARLKPSVPPLAPLSRDAVISRADAAIADLIGGGRLSYAQSQRFVKLMVEQSMFLPPTDPNLWPVIRARVAS